MSRKISFRFILYFLGFYAFTVLLTISLLVYYLAEPIMGFDVFTNIREVDQEQLANHISKDSEGNYNFSEKLVAFTEKNKGVLQILDSEGNVIQSTTNDDFYPVHYHFADLIQFEQEENYFSWLLEGDKTVLFIQRTKSDQLMEQLIQLDDFPILTEKANALIEEYHAVFSLYDPNGNVIDTTDEQENFTNNEILHKSFSIIYSEEIKSFHTLENGAVASVRIPNPDYESYEAFNNKITIQFLTALAIFHGLLLIIVLAFSLLIGQRFGRPIFYFLKRIERLAKDDYSDFNDKKIRVSKTGKLKKKYKFYKDVDDSLTLLTQNLKRNEQQIKQTEQLREDWITGLSHDLKTPLSTVLGYSIMLGSSHEWTKDEIMKFAEMIEEKASYMDNLINDLTYTYQLKNKGIALDLVQTDLNCYLNDFLNSNDLENVYFDPNFLAVHALIDSKRFSRVLDNIIGNAITHNQPNTTVILDVSTDGNKAIIEIKDNGSGMNEETLANLFNRYYRGGNTTSEDIGTGLGLTIARQLVEAHNGTITVTSNQQGTKIQITLPLVK